MPKGKYILKFLLGSFPCAGLYALFIPVPKSLIFRLTLDRRTVFGITQHTSKGHIARATLEATCFQTKAILDAMERDSERPIDLLAVDGGMTNSDLCMQVGSLSSKIFASIDSLKTQADIIGISVDRPVMRETTSLGAALAAGYAIGMWKDFVELETLNRDDRTVFRPQISRASRDEMYRRWERAVRMSKGWVTSDDIQD